MPEKISIREYARRLNINEKAVRKAIGGGLIADGYDKEAKKIIPETANAEWGYKHEVVKSRPGVSRVKTAEKMNAAPIAAAKPSEAAEPVSSTPGGIAAIPAHTYANGVPLPLDNPLAVDLLQSILITSTLPVGEAVRLREIIGAQQDKLKLAEAEGRLVAKDKVEKALFALGSELKKALLNIPTRTVRDIMAARNEVDGINILTDEITAVLNTFGNMNKDTL